MKSKKAITSDKNKKLNDPSKVDPTKKDERDNDATRIRPQKEGTTDDPGEENQNAKEQEISPYKRVQHKPEPESQPGKQQGSEINKSFNPAVPQKGESEERDDQGNPVMKRFGKGL